LDLPLFLSGITASRNSAQIRNQQTPGDSPWTEIHPRANGPDLAQLRENQVSSKEPLRQLRLHINGPGFPGTPIAMCLLLKKLRAWFFYRTAYRTWIILRTFLHAGGDTFTRMHDS
jgi:hypothetical protein